MHLQRRARTTGHAIVHRAVVRYEVMHRCSDYAGYSSARCTELFEVQLHKRCRWRDPQQLADVCCKVHYTTADTDSSSLLAILGIPTRKDFFPLAVRGSGLIVRLIVGTNGALRMELLEESLSIKKPLAGILAYLHSKSSHRSTLRVPCSVPGFPICLIL